MGAGFLRNFGGYAGGIKLRIQRKEGHVVEGTQAGTQESGTNGFNEPIQGGVTDV